MTIQIDVAQLGPALVEDLSQNGGEITLTRDGRKLRVIFARGGEGSAATQAAAYSAVLLRRGEAVRWSALAPGACYLLLGDAAEATVGGAPASEAIPALR